MNTTVKWLVCVIVKNWALQNGLKNKHLFTSYALIWLVLFYLMTEKVVPSLIELRKYATEADHKVIEGTYIIYPYLLKLYLNVYIYILTFNQDGTVRSENVCALSVKINALNC